MEQKFSNIKTRILEYADINNFSKRKIYRDTGIANGVLDKSTGLTEDNIEKFISTYVDVNIDWLITGKGKMLKMYNEELSGKTIVNEPEVIYKNKCAVCAEKDKLINRLEHQTLIYEKEIDWLRNQIDCTEESTTKQAG